MPEGPFLHPYHAADYYSTIDSNNVIRNPEVERQKKQGRVDRVRLKQAHEEASMSNCVKHSVGAIITDAEGRIISTGYNGSPEGCDNCNDVFSSWDYTVSKMKELIDQHTVTGQGELAGAYAQELDDYYSRHHEWSKKHELHAEANAILHSDRSKRDGGTLYVNLQPCHECAKLIAGSGIKRVVFGVTYHRSDEEQVVELFKKRGIEYKHIPNLID